MPSPFPGMDPYTESRSAWPVLHYRLPGLAADQLQPQLAPRYVAMAEERVYLEEPHEEIVPDISLRRRPRAEGDRATGVAVAEQTVTGLSLWIEAPEPVEAREYFIEIRSLPDQELITVIELLSPSNKRMAGRGRARYLRKQQRILQSKVNLVEIDLLRRGAWTVALPEPAPGDLEPHDYRVCVRRAARPGGFEFYPLGLRQPLPAARIPLRNDDADVLLDLAALFTEAYDRSMVATRIDYESEPDPPLRPAEAGWADELLRLAGLRPPQ